MIYVLFYGLCDGLRLNVRTSVCVFVCVYEGLQIVLRNRCNLSRGAVKAVRSKPPHNSTLCSKLEVTRAREISFLNQMLHSDLSVRNQTPSLLLGWHEVEV